jgi:hypothetical protein
MGVLPDRIALVGTGIPGGGSILGDHLKAFLESNGIQVDFFDGNLYTLRLYRLQRSDPQAAKRPLLKLVVEEMARSIRQGDYPVVIVIERDDILLEDLGGETRRFYFPACSLSYERYYGWLYEGDPEAEVKFQKALNLERRIYQAADVVTIAWNTYEAFVREKIYDGSNIVSHPGLGWYGCDPQPQRVTCQDELRVVFLGHLYYWTNPELLVDLTARSPFPLHCFGRTYVPTDGLDHFGYAKDVLSVLRGYPFGLNTISEDPLRKATLSSKVLTYMSLGLPSFSPSWQRFSHQVEGVIPYEADNFVELVAYYHQPDVWQTLSDAAYEQAHELRWEKVLQPMLGIL